MQRYRKGLIVGVCAAAVYLAMVLGMRSSLTRLLAVFTRAPNLHREVRQVDDLTYRTLDGQVLHASSLKGKVVFVNIWGSWCAPCVMEMPTVQKLYGSYKSDPNVVFVIAAALDTPEAVRRYARRNHMELPFYYTVQGDIPVSMHVNHFPTTLIYAKDGTVAAEHMGRADWSAPSVVAFLHQLEQEPYMPHRVPAPVHPKPSQHPDMLASLQ